MITRENAIEVLSKLPAILNGLSNEQKRDLTEALELAVYALHPVSRESVRRLYTGCDNCRTCCDTCENMYAWDKYGKPQECTDCKESGYLNYSPDSNFCENCGKPLTDKAMDILIEKLEALYETEG